MRLIARAAMELKTEYPQIHFHLYSGNADDVTDRLEKGLLDLGVFIEPADTAKYEALRLPRPDRWGLLVRRDSSYVSRHVIRAEDLKGLPLLVSRQSLLHHQLSQWLQMDMDELNIIGTYNLLYNASLMVEEGLGCALCLDKLLHTAGPDSQLCFIPLDPPLKAHQALVWKKYQVFSKATDLYLRKLTEVLLSEK